jgi:hypothetical protein
MNKNCELQLPLLSRFQPCYSYPLNIIFTIFICFSRKLCQYYAQKICTSQKETISKYIVTTRNRITGLTHTWKSIIVLGYLDCAVGICYSYYKCFCLNGLLALICEKLNKYSDFTLSYKKYLYRFIEGYLFDSLRGENFFLLCTTSTQILSPIQSSTQFIP